MGTGDDGVFLKGLIQNGDFGDNRAHAKLITMKAKHTHTFIIYLKKKNNNRVDEFFLFNQGIKH